MSTGKWGCRSHGSGVQAESGEMLAEVKLLKAEEKRLAREIQKEQQQANLLSMRFGTVCLKYGTTDDEENNLV